MAKIVSVGFKATKDLPKEVIESKKFGDKKFVEIRVENSEPNIAMDGVDSPAIRVKEILREHKVKINL